MIGKVLILSSGKDITHLCRKIDNISEKKTFQRDKLINNNFILDVNNTDKLFSVHNSKSLFKGIDYIYDILKVWNSQNEIVWDGVIKKIERDYNTMTAKIYSVNILHKFMNIEIEYTSSDWETVPEAVLNVFTKYGYTNFDNKSFQKSITILKENNCFIKCNINKKDKLIFIQFIEKMAEMAGADAYSRANNIYFNVWEKFKGGTKTKINEKDIYSFEKITTNEKDLINNYSISYSGDGGTPATDENNNNIGLLSRNKFGVHDLPSMSTGESSMIMFKDKISAVFVGELYLKRTHYDLEKNPRPLEIINFTLSADNKKWIDLETFFKLTLNFEDWTNKVFEVFSINVNTENNIMDIMAYEVNA